MSKNSNWVHTWWPPIGDTMEAKPTITEFLKARIAEDEQVARATQGLAHLDDGRSGAGHWKVDWTGMRFPEKAVADYAAHHDPARALAECAAKRAIIERHANCDDVSYGDASTCPEIRALAAVYADHPNYQQGWAA